MIILQVGTYIFATFMYWLSQVLKGRRTSWEIFYKWEIYYKNIYSDLFNLKLSNSKYFQIIVKKYKKYLGIFFGQEVQYKYKYKVKYFLEPVKFKTQECKKKII